MPALSWSLQCSRLIKQGGSPPAITNGLGLRSRLQVSWLARLCHGLNRYIITSPLCVCVWSCKNPQANCTLAPGLGKRATSARRSWIVPLCGFLSSMPMGSSWWSKIGSRFSISIESGAGDLHQSGGIPHKTAASFLKGISFVTFTGNCASADIQLAWYMAEHLVPEWTSRMAGVGGQCWSNLIKAFAAALHSRHSQGKWKLCIWGFIK